MPPSTPTWRAKSRSTSSEHRLRHKDGIVPLDPGPRGRPARRQRPAVPHGRVAHGRDRPEGRAEALRREHELLTALMDNIPDAIYFKDRDSRFVRVNAALARRFGLANPGDAVGKSDGDFFPPSRPNGWGDDEQEVMRTGQPSSAARSRRSGRTAAITWASDHEDAAPRPGRSGRRDVRHVAGHHAARSRPRPNCGRPRRRPRRADRVLDSILKNLADGVIVADQDGQVHPLQRGGRADPRESERSRRGVDEWTDRYGVFLPDGVTPYPPHELPLARAMRGEEVRDAEMFIRNARKPDGVWLSINGRPLRDDTGHLRGGVIVFRDVTERKRAEAELQRAKEAAECGQPGQERVPGQHEPRDSHADERHHRHGQSDTCHVLAAPGYRCVLLIFSHQPLSSTPLTMRCCWVTSPSVWIVTRGVGLPQPVEPDRDRKVDERDDPAPEQEPTPPQPILGRRTRLVRHSAILPVGGPRPRSAVPALTSAARQTVGAAARFRIELEDFEIRRLDHQVRPRI